MFKILLTDKQTNHCLLSFSEKLDGDFQGLVQK